MRSRKSSNDQVAEVARRRLELLSAELAAIRRDPPGSPTPAGADGSGELPGPSALPPSVDRRRVGEQGRAGAPGRHARRPGPGRVGGWLHDRLPAPLQGRVRIGAPQLAALAVVVATAMGLLAWWTVRATDAGELVATGAVTGKAHSPAPLVTPSASPSVLRAGFPSGAPAPAAPPDGVIVVDVAGKVRDPGIARLPAGSRVIDALEAAGGARRGVDLSSLNLARVLVDGEQVLVGVPQPTGLVPSAAAAVPGGAGPSALVSLNRADQAALETLPGVGPVTARAILQWRAEHGAFSAVEELLEVSGIGDATLAEIAPFVTL